MPKMASTGKTSAMCRECPKSTCAENVKMATMMGLLKKTKFKMADCQENRRSSANSSSRTWSIRPTKYFSHT